MDTFFEGASPPEAIPRLDPSSNPFRDTDPDLLSFGASTRTREPSPSPTPTLYRPPPDTLRSPTPSPDAGAAARNAQQDAVHGYDRDAGAVGQLGRRTDAPARGGVDDGVDARPHRVRSLDEDERRELDFWRDEARAQEELRRVERDRQSAGLSPQRNVGGALRERADVSVALEIRRLNASVTFVGAWRVWPTTNRPLRRLRFPLASDADSAGATNRTTTWHYASLRIGIPQYEF